MWDWNGKGFAFCDSLYFKMRGSYFYVIAISPPHYFWSVRSRLVLFVFYFVFENSDTDQTSRHSAMWCGPTRIVGRSNQFLAKNDVDIYFIPVQGDSPFSV